MSQEERIAVLRQMRLHQHWIDIHKERLREAVIEANRLGMPLTRIAGILGISANTVAYKYLGRTRSHGENFPTQGKVE